MLDALCHAIESFWSINSNDESKAYSAKAMRMILDNKNAYLDNDVQGNKNMLEAAHIAGKAINITQTTASHAMCYKLTSLYGIAHGHAAAICLVKIWFYMVANLDKCIDPRGPKYLEKLFLDIASVMGCSNSYDAPELFQQILNELGIDTPNIGNEAEYDILTKSVNMVRLRNNPIRLEVETIDRLFHQILSRGEMK